LEAFVRAKECTGNAVFKLNPATKDPRGAGGRSNCSECHKLTNFYCLNYRRWLCGPHLAANREKPEGPKFIKIGLHNYKKTDDCEQICAILSCWHNAHKEALDKDGAFARGWCVVADDDVSSMTSF